MHGFWGVGGYECVVSAGVLGGRGLVLGGGGRGSGARRRCLAAGSGSWWSMCRRALTTNCLYCGIETRGGPIREVKPQKRGPRRRPRKHWKTIVGKKMRPRGSNPSH